MSFPYTDQLFYCFPCPMDFCTPEEHSFPTWVRAGACLGFFCKMPDATEEDMEVLEWEVYYIIYMHQENFPLRGCFVPYNLKICGLLQ